MAGYKIVNGTAYVKTGTLYVDSMLGSSVEDKFVVENNTPVWDGYSGTGSFLIRGEARIPPSVVPAPAWERIG